MKFRKGLYIVFLCVGVALFTLSLLPFFRAFAPETFWILTVVAASIVALCLFALLYTPQGKPVKLNARYERKKSIMSRPEHQFLMTLRQIYPDRYEVIPQMGLYTVIDKVTNTSYRNELFRVCDYCFVDKVTFEPLLLVELNDKSHNRADRRQRDERVAAICKAAKLPLVTFWMTDDLSYAAVKKVIMKNIL